MAKTPKAIPEQTGKKPAPGLRQLPMPRCKLSMQMYRERKKKKTGGAMSLRVI
jgi:hypothetical protein